jgi:hypothetical protein
MEVVLSRASRSIILLSYVSICRVPGSLIEAILVQIEQQPSPLPFLHYIALFCGFVRVSLIQIELQTFLHSSQRGGAFIDQQISSME